MLSLFKNSKAHSKGKVRKQFKKIASQESITKVYERFTKADNKKNERKSLLKIIEMCYDNLANQIQLTEMLHLPFLPGPISLHAFPTVLLEQDQAIGHRGEGEEGEQTQLEFLFNYLKNVKEYYYCWLIYFNEDLKILNVKLLKREEIEDNEEMFNPILNLIGIFVNRPTKEKPSKLPRPEANRDYVDQYYGRGLQRQPVDPYHNKSISTINSSTGTTWKAMAKMEKIKEDNEEKESECHYKGESKQKMESRILKVRNKEPKKYSLSKWNEQPKIIKKQNKSFSIKQLKQKSKSQILLNRSKSNNLKEIILQPVKTDEKFKVFQAKTKLKKESKVNKIASIYFKKPGNAE